MNYPAPRQFKRPDIMKGGNAQRWAEYEDLRDELVGRHQACLAAGKRTPRNIWLFTPVGTPTAALTIQLRVSPN